MRIIGIDPGYDRIGIAVVEKSSPKDKEVLVYSECFTTSHVTAPNHNSAISTKRVAPTIHDRLLSVGQRIKAIIEEYAPSAMAMETLFITKNQKTAMRVSEARGIIAYEATGHGLPIFEYSPPQIKAAVTGNGQSDKNAIIKMIPLLVKMQVAKRHDDEYDAIAVALTCIACNPKK